MGCKQRILFANAMGVAHGDARLACATHALLDKAPMPA